MGLSVEPWMMYLEPLTHNRCSQNSYIAVIGGVKAPVNVNFLEGGGKCLKRLMSVSVRSQASGSKYLWSTSYVPELF